MLKGKETCFANCLSSLLFVAAPATAQDQDPLKLLPKNYQLELENDYVRVIHVKYGAHEKTPMHAHPVSDPVLIVALTDENIKFTLPDERVIVSNRKPGEALWFEGANRIPKHAVENLSDKAFEGLRIEIKARPAGTTKP